MAHVPVVFISSTSEDLKEHRAQAELAAKSHEFYPRMMEYFPANGRTPTLQACLEEVAKAEVVVVLVAHRYGWVPDDPTNPDAKSITWLECEHAWNVTKKEVLAFVVDPNHQWPAELREDYRLVTERKKPGIAAEVDRNEAKLAEFKQKLSGKFRGQFTDAASVRALVGEALADWRRRNMPDAAVPPGDPEIYLKALEDETRQIRIKGLKTKRAEPYFFGIDEIYIPLTTQAGHEAPRRGAVQDMEQQRRIVLEQTLSHRKVVIVGDPGSGKSTFLRRVAFELCRTLRGTLPAGSPPFLASGDRRFPILIRVAGLAALLAADKLPKPLDSPDWIPYFLGKQSEEYKSGVGEAFFRRKLDEDACLVLVDGLDEAPERHMRERVARLFERATQAFPKCDFLVSTRPQTYTGDSALAGFEPVRVDNLDLPEMRSFFDHLARAMALSDAESKRFNEGLELALASRPEIREIAANPVTLTALAVLQHNDQRLPEHRVELYGSILNWLAAAREHKEGRPPAEKCLEYMRTLALHMQDAPEGRLVQVNKRSAAEALVNEFGGSVEAAEDLLERETQGSGIISSVGRDVRFWHLSYQEYLAARGIAALPDRELFGLLFGREKIHQREWREVVLLLAAILRSQGTKKADWFIKELLEHGQAGSPSAKALSLVLLDAILRDLQGLAYHLPLELRGLAGSILTSLTQSGLNDLDLGLWLKLVDAATRGDFASAPEVQAITIPASALLKRALDDEDVQTRDLAAGALLAKHFDDASVRSALLQVAVEGCNRPVRPRIERAFEGRFPAWKRWLAGVDGEAPVPEMFERTTVPLRVARLRLRNIKAFEDTGVVEFGTRCSLFVGDNSVGKSTLLRCIALAMAGVELANQIEPRALTYLRDGAEEGAIEVSFVPGLGHDFIEDEFVVGLSISQGETGFRSLDARRLTLSIHNSTSRLDVLRRRTDDGFGFLCAYGPFRTFSDPSSPVPAKAKIAIDRVVSLFDPHASVVDPDLAMKLFSGQLAGFRAAPDRLSPDIHAAIQEHLHNLLPGCDKAGITFSSGMPVRGGAVALRDLSDGYASLVALIGHLFRYALESSGWMDDPAAVSGIALIDEVDAHLHPEWQRRVLPDLASVFPNLQILATTHSPLVAGSLDARSIHHLARPQEARGVEIRKYELALHGLEADAILTGPLFGLDDTRDLQTQEAEKRYDELRALTSPSADQLAERAAIAGKLFGRTAEELQSSTREAFEALEDSIKEKLKATSPEEMARRLAAAEKLIESTFAKR